MVVTDFSLYIWLDTGLAASAYSITVSVVSNSFSLSIDTNVRAYPLPRRCGGVYTYPIALAVSDYGD